MKIQRGISCEKIARKIKFGQTLVLPFDTVYGLVADPFNDKAMERIYKIKGRDFDKPITLIFSSVEMLKKYIEIDSDTKKFISDKIPGAFTFIFPWTDSERKKFAKQYLALEKVGIRIPDHKFILNAVEELGQPIAATSANISDMPNCWNAQEFVEQIKNQDEKPDLVVDGGVLPKNPPSEVIDITNLSDIETIRLRN